MFYNSNPEDKIRFGDVLYGRVMTTPSIKSKGVETSSECWQIEVNHPRYSVVLTPCCTVEKERDCYLLVAPLVAIRGSLACNEYFAEDFTRINKPIRPENTVSSDLWNDPKYKEKRELAISIGETYSFLDCFVYKENKLFREYEIPLKGRGNLKTRYYMVDFRKTHRIIWDAIEQSSQEHALSTKILELANDSREELRKKITLFFGRRPEEHL